MNQELQDYIKKARETGMNDGQIKQELLKVGWQEKDINSEFGSVFVPMPTPTPKPTPIYAPKKVETFSDSIKQENKSKLPIIALIVTIVILLAGIGVFGYIYLIKPSAPKNVVDDQENQATDNKVVKPTIKDCGTVNMQSIFSNLSSKTPLAGMPSNGAESLRCMDNSLVDCQQAKFKIIISQTALSAETEMIYEIKGKDGQNCLINGPFGKNEEYQTCKILPTYPAEIKAGLTQYSDSNGLVFFSTIMEISTNVTFVPSDFVGSSRPIGPVKYTKTDATGTTTMDFYNYDCK